jgi:hypothetical protein
MAKNPFDSIVDRTAERMASIVERMPADVEPFGVQKLSREEQLQRYTEMRDNPTAWMQIISEQGLKAAVDYWKTMEVRYGKRA